MTYEEIISRVSAETGLTTRLVDRTYKAYWKVIREYIKSLPLKEDLTDEEFMQLRPNINLPSLGKLNVTYHGMKKHFEMHYKNYKGKKYKKQDSNAEDNKD